MAAQDAPRSLTISVCAKVKAYVKGPGSGREAAIRFVHAAGIEVTEIVDVTPLPHNGCRPPKRKKSDRNQPIKSHPPRPQMRNGPSFLLFSRQSRLRKGQGVRICKNEYIKWQDTQDQKLKSPVSSASQYLAMTKCWLRRTILRASMVPTVGRKLPSTAPSFAKSRKLNTHTVSRSVSSATSLKRRRAPKGIHRRGAPPAPRIPSRQRRVPSRSGCKPSRHARQLVLHKHICVNGKNVNIPSYRVMSGDVITVREKSKVARGYRRRNVRLQP